MKYIEPFTELFTICMQIEKDWYINLFQGNGFVQSFGGLVDYFRDNVRQTSVRWYCIVCRHIVEKK